MFLLSNFSRYCDYLGGHGQFGRIELFRCAGFGPPLCRERQTQRLHCVNLGHTKDDKFGFDGCIHGQKCWACLGPALVLEPLEPILSGL